VRPLRSFRPRPRGRCTIIVTLELEQVASAFNGMGAAGRLSCPSIGFLESFQGGPIANGRVERTHVEFDFGDPTWHHTGYSSSSTGMSGGFTMRLHDGTSLTGGWTATRVATVVLDREPGTDAGTVPDAPSLRDVARRVRRVVSQSGD